MFRIGIVEDDPLSALGLRYLLGSEPGMRVAFATNDIDAVDRGDIDCLVIDSRLLPALFARPAGAYTVVSLAAAEQDTSPDDRIAAVCLRDQAAAHLAGTVRQSVRPRPAGTSYVATLSPREQEVLRHIAAGLTHGQVANRIGISHHTVDTYVKRIRVKLGVGNKAQLVRAAVAMAVA